MITTGELEDRKQARKAREVQQHLLEEVVERRVCEGIYDRIYRHKSTQDEAEDGKLRSKTAALALVGIGPSDLGVELGDGAEISPEETATETSEIRERLAPARQDIASMSQVRYPLGKINHLKAAHRSIVDTIAYFRPSASADEIMPMLIFTLITLPPEDLHVISDIRFIQSFRWEPKLNGEAAYCLTNLEAAISFLQTVDLATLRSDELLSGPPKGFAKSGTFPPAYPQESTPSEAEITKANAEAEAVKQSASSALKAAAAQQQQQQKGRRLSEMVPNPAQAFGAASDAVFNTADQGLKTVTASLGDSYKFFLGKIRDSQDGLKESIALPRTLEDARKLVSNTPPPPKGNPVNPVPALEPAIEDDSGAGDHKVKRQSVSSRVSSLIRHPSAESATEAKRKEDMPLDDKDKDKATVAPPEVSRTSAPMPPAQTPLMFQQVRSLSHTFIPSRFSTQLDGMIRGFGRNSIAAPTVTTPAAPTSSLATSTPISTSIQKESVDASKPVDGGDLATVRPPSPTLQVLPC